jgi:AcrR family transcriptional regulator
MAAHGYTGASISRIENASGLPASSIYWHFGSKEGVLLAMMQRGADRFFAAIPRADEREGSPLERIDASLAIAARALGAAPQFPRLLIALGLQHSDEPEVIKLIRDVRRRARGMFEDAIGAALEGLPAAERDEAATELACYALAFTDGAFVAHQIDADVDLEGLFAQLGASLRSMVLARAGG